MRALCSMHAQAMHQHLPSWCCFPSHPSESSRTPCGRLNVHCQNWDGPEVQPSRPGLRPRLQGQVPRAGDREVTGGGPGWHGAGSGDPRTSRPKGNKGQRPWGGEGEAKGAAAWPWEPDPLEPRSTLAPAWRPWLQPGATVGPRSGRPLERCMVCSLRMMSALTSM